MLRKTSRYGLNTTRWAKGKEGRVIHQHQLLIAPMYVASLSLLSLVAGSIKYCYG